jgi:repressor of nif and glnA expression
MTDYLGAISTGNGRVGAGFREVPAESRETVVLLAERLQRVGLGAVLEIGWSGQPLFGIPVGQGHAGLVVVGGLNPISILEEMGHRVESRALAGLLEFSRLFHYSELSDRLAEMAP